MPVLDRPTTVHAPDQSVQQRPVESTVELRCVVCHTAFDFAAGQTALVLKHIAYGYDFVHTGQCLATARSWIFVEPGFDRPAFSTDGQRVRILRVESADGWAAALPNAPELAEAGNAVRYEPLRFWAVVEYRDGHRRIEGVIRANEWLDEPGGAEFPDARTGHRSSLGYVRTDDSPPLG